MPRLLSILLLTPTAPLLAATITVNTIADTIAVDGFCSLHEAILAANTDTAVNECPAGNGADSIVFDLGPGVPEIVLTQALPIIEEPLSIDGGTGGATRVSIHGAGAIFNGLNLHGTGPHQVRSLVLGGFASSVIFATAETTIQNAYIGTNVAGTGASGATIGIHLSGGGLIGGDQPGDGNLISGNSLGVFVDGAGNARILGNRIGTDASGQIALGNQRGIAAEVGNGLLIGGAGPGQGNVIAGNALHGIAIDSNASNITIQGNHIGVAADGQTALGNGGNGILLSNAFNVLVGADGFEAGGNLIAGNGGLGLRVQGANSRAINVFGNRFGSDAAGASALGGDVHIGILADPTEIRIGSLEGTDPAAGCRGRCNLFVGGDAGILDGAEGSRIEGNVFGLDQSGSQALGGGLNAIQLSGSQTVVRENRIADFLGQALFVTGAGGHLIERNWIGVAADGQTLIGNGGGITIGADASVIRENRIAGNGFGVEVAGSPGQYPYGVRISRNSIQDHILLGIDLRDPGIEPNGGVTANDPLDADDGPNRNQNFPDLVSATTAGNRLVGSLSSSANAAFTIEFFQSPGCHASGHGEGAQFLGDSVVQTDADGMAVFDLASPVALTAGAFVTATATDADDNTSEFSACVQVLAGEEPPPPPPPPAAAVPVPLGSPWTWAILVGLILLLVARQDRRP